MACGVYRVLARFAVLVAIGTLVACSGGGFLAEREPWRKEAEARCLSAGAVREGAGVVRIAPISGPGMCGADHPFRVTSLGQPGALGFFDEMRPPGAIPGAKAAPPRWPIVEPLPLDLPKATADPAKADVYDFRKPYGASPPPAKSEPRSSVRTQPLDHDSPAYDLSPEPYEQRRALNGRPPPPAERVQPPPAPSRAQMREPAHEPRYLPQQLGPSRVPRQASASVSFSPPATLACPMVSMLDQWIAEAVQPAAVRWFGQPVVEIRQISAYSCRGMNGNPNARISEHAFGNALDIASFTLANGRRITVRDGWRGAPEEQGFLRDVQGAACDRFSTVLAPGSNQYHYDHMHVDLMRRRNGYRTCNPRAVSGEEVAARARAHYAQQGRDPNVTGSVGKRKNGKLPPAAFTGDKVGHQLPIAIPGEDGED